MKNYGSQTYEDLIRYEEMINRSIPLVQKEYEKESFKLSQEQQKNVDKATDQRYIVLYDKSPKAAYALRHVCKKWSEANKTPIVFIGPYTRNTNKTSTHIEFNPMWATPYEVHPSIYIPDLPDFHNKSEDETFYIMMLLAHEYTWSRGTLHLDCVPVHNAEEIARQLLGIYDRAYQRNLQSQFPQFAQI